MLVLWGWDVGMSTTAAILLVLGALVVGIAAQVVGEVKVGYEWAVTALFALVGGYIGSEALGAASTWGPEFQGLYVVPAAIGGILFGAIADAILRYATHGSYVEHPRPI